MNTAGIKRRIREAREYRRRRRKALAQFRRDRDRWLRKYDALVEGGADPESDRLRELAHKAKHADVRVGEINNRIERVSEKIGELLPRFRKRSRRKERLLRDVRRLRRKIRRHRQEAAAQDGIVTYDGKPVAAHFVPWLQKIRAAGWDGILVSGYRTPEYSESLCYAMCGAPSCPGRCAGRASKHSQKVPIDGAVDLSDYGEAGVLFKRVGAPYYNALGAADPVHFSNTGH